MQKVMIGKFLINLQFDKAADFSEGLIQPTTLSVALTPVSTPTTAAQRGNARTRSAPWTMPRRSGSRSSTSKVTEKSAPTCAISPKASRPAHNGD